METLKLMVILSVRYKAMESNMCAFQWRKCGAIWKMCQNK